MDANVKAQWLTALRSGEYEQAKEALYRVAPSAAASDPEDEEYDDRGFGFCCLGVLVDLYLKETGGEWEMPTYTCESQFGGSAAYLPRCVQEWSGVSEQGVLQSPVTTGAGVAYGLAELNDNHGFDFNQIADVIEAQF